MGAEPADTEHGLVRLGTLAATAIAFVMAVSVEDAFDADNELWFVVPYLLVRVLGLALYARVAAEREQHLAAVRTFAALSTFGFAVVLIGGFADPDARVWWWLAAVVLDLLVGRPRWRASTAGTSILSTSRSATDCS